jgi:hypothetical protein
MLYDLLNQEEQQEEEPPNSSEYCIAWTTFTCKHEGKKSYKDFIIDTIDYIVETYKERYNAKYAATRKPCYYQQPAVPYIPMLEPCDMPPIDNVHVSKPKPFRWIIRAEHLDHEPLDPSEEWPKYACFDINIYKNNEKYYQIEFHSYSSEKSYEKEFLRNYMSGVNVYWEIYRETKKALEEDGFIHYRYPYLMLFEGITVYDDDEETQKIVGVMNGNEHTIKYIYNEYIMREICTFLA